jgi:CHAT domain-containing protein
LSGIRGDLVEKHDARTIEQAGIPERDERRGGISLFRSFDRCLKSYKLFIATGWGPRGTKPISALDVSCQHMRPNSLVVLASCDSSVGNSKDGIEMRGLTSAFLISGAGSVVASLWLVDTVSTSRLVSDFHNGFARRISVAEALRQAQMTFIKSGPRSTHPYFWYGFVVTGSLSTLQ